MAMKKFFLILMIAGFLFAFNQVNAQCSICTKTASQLGEKAGKGLNLGILYLMLTPFTVAGIVALKVFRQEKKLNAPKKN